MEAIQADMAEQDDEDYEEGHGLDDDEAEMLHKLENEVADSDNDDYEGSSKKKLDTVREGNETNP